MSGYMAGDEVKIDPFEFLHEMNVKEVTATSSYTRTASTRSS
jgi:hypothetical protein